MFFFAALNLILTLSFFSELKNVWRICKDSTRSEKSLWTGDIKSFLRVPYSVLLSCETEVFIPCLQRSLIAREEGKERKRPALPAPDAFSHVAADHIGGRNVLVFKTGFV